MVHQAFTESDRYAELVDRRGKHRCVTIDYEDDFHIDVVPSIEVNGECLIMNRQSNDFEPTDGDGYARWFANENEITGGKLVQVGRLAKYLRDEHEWAVRSIMITTLLGNMVSDEDSSDAYVDLPTALNTLFRRLDEWLQFQEQKPEVVNPALPDERFDRGWEDEVFDELRVEVHRLAATIGQAIGETDAETSAAKWQEALGEDFSILDEDLPGGSGVASAPLSLQKADHAKPLSEIAQAVAITCRVNIEATVYNKSGKIQFGSINSGGTVAAARAIRFKVWTDAKEPYDVQWQVVNTGPHAARNNALRGGFLAGRRLDGSPAQTLHN